MNMFTILVIIFSIFSNAAGTTDLLTSLTGGADPVLLPSVNAGETLNNLAPAALPPKEQTFFDKLTSPFAALVQGGLPCFGQTSLKSGTCKEFDSCAASGGFGDGKGFCLGQSVCCVAPAKCGDFSLLNNTVIANPGFPNPTIDTGSCDVKIVKPAGIVYIKLLIEDLELAQPNHKTGKCDIDALKVTGGVIPGFGIPEICGLNSKTHIYIPTVKEIADIFIKVQLSDDGSIKRRWLLRAEMIDEKSSEKPPSGCAQYFREGSGLVSSLNFDLIGKTGLGNIDGLNYGICFAGGHGACSISFKPLFFDLGGKISSHSTNVPSSVGSSRVSRAAPVQPNRPAYRPIGMRPPSFIPAQYLRPNRPYQLARPFAKVNPQKVNSFYSRPPFTAQQYPYAPFLFKVPLGANSLYMHRPMALYPSELFAGQYKPPMKKPDVNLGKLDDKLDDKLDKFDKLDKLESLLADKLGKPELLADLSLHKICPDQDTVVFPIPDDGTSPIHCGNEFHFGGELISSLPPFMIRVSNKGLHHGKGFAVTYKVQC